MVYLCIRHLPTQIHFCLRVESNAHSSSQVLFVRQKSQEDSSSAVGIQGGCRHCHLHDESVASSWRDLEESQMHGQTPLPQNTKTSHSIINADTPSCSTQCCQSSPRASPSCACSTSRCSPRTGAGRCTGLVSEQQSPGRRSPGRRTSSDCSNRQTPRRRLDLSRIQAHCQGILSSSCLDTGNEALRISLNLSQVECSCNLHQAHISCRIQGVQGRSGLGGEAACVSGKNDSKRSV